MENTDFRYYPQVLYKNLHILRIFTRLNNFFVSISFFQNMLTSAFFAETGEIRVKAAKD